jgi:hypothetical protein
MASGAERRKGMRAAVPVVFDFNILDAHGEYNRGSNSALRRLSALDSVKAPAARTESQVLLSRIDQKLSILISILAETSNRKSYAHNAVVVDISEFGLAFVHALAIEKGSSLEIGLHLLLDDNIKVIDLAGTVVHVKPSPEPGEGSKKIYGVEFYDIQSKDRDDIMQWIFAHQREQIRRRREKDLG